MVNTAKAFLRTQGDSEHRGFHFSYYTYSMEDKPNRYHVNVNVSLKHDQNDYTISLALDKSFGKEADAIKYGIAEGEKFIDKAYKDGRIKTKV